MTGVLAVPLVLGIGMAVDYSRHMSASKHLQEVADSVSLALAGSSERNADKMVLLAQKIINSNITSTRIDTVEPVTKANFTITNDDIDVKLYGNIETSFMGIAGYHVLGVAAESLATRAVNGSVEVALVLDNTWSMSENGKIVSLRSAAGALVDTLMPNSNSNVKISLVPYADYVNVGVENRNKPWVSVPEDIPAVAAKCDKEQVWVTNGCSKWTYDTCTRTVDGVPETYNCNGVCTVPRAPYWATQNVNCKGGVSGQKWYGCVGSRKIGHTRLDDGSPNVAYPGYVETSQRCLNPIIPLTSTKATLKTAVDGMIINIGTGYRPYTYIPAGMIWGVNVLSPTAPFEEGLSYDSQNKAPRKAIVLMTDGENTLKYRPSDGRHVAFSTNGNAGAVEYKKVNDETNDICTYAKNKNIEVFTVAFMVDNNDAKAMLQACATDAQHYFDASDPDKLMSAFDGIAQSLQVVRLAR
jgi:Flp pilus assembly protein TadG